MFDELSDLRLFVRVTQAGSLSEAARRAHTSVTSVSRRLTSFEDRLGVRLIDRGSRRFSLTEEGQLLRERAVPIIQAVDSAKAELDTLSSVARGLLRVSAPHEIGRRRVAAISREFTNQHPEVNVELRLTDSRPDILEEDLDIAILTKRPTAEDVVHRKLLSGRRVICASPEYLQRRGRPQRPEELVNHDCIRMVRGSQLYDQWTVKGPHGPSKVQVSGALISNCTDTIHTWALEGAGIAVKALWDIEDDLRSGRLVELLAEFACDEMHLYATHFARRHVPPRIRLFIDFLAQRLQHSEIRT